MAHKKNRMYVLYTFKKSYFTQTFKWESQYCTRDELVTVIAAKKLYGHSDVLNSLVADRDCISSDTHGIAFKLYDIESACYREVYSLRKKDNGQIDLKALAKDVDSKVAQIEKEREIRREHYAKLKEREQFVFRDGPVPYTGCHRYRGRYYRRPKLHRLKVQSEIVEYKEFIKGNERKENLPTWDDRPRRRSHSWKDSYKCRKQWMKNNKTHVDTVSIDKTMESALE